MRHTLTERERQFLGDVEVGLRKDRGLRVDEQLVLVLDDGVEKAATGRRRTEIFRIGGLVVVGLEITLLTMLVVQARYPADPGVGRRVRGQASGLGVIAQRRGRADPLRLEEVGLPPLEDYPATRADVTALLSP